MPRWSASLNVVGVEKPDAVDLAAGGEGAVDARDRSRGGMPVGGWELRRAPLRGVDGAVAGDAGRVQICERGHLGHLRAVHRAAHLREEEVGAPRLIRRGQAEVEVRAERAGDLIGEEAPDTAAADAAHQLPDEEAVGVDVVAVGGAGLPPRLLRGELAGHQVPVVHRTRRQRRSYRRQACPVREDHPSADGVLAAGRQLGPVQRRRLVEIEQAPLGEHQQAQRGHRLADREHVDERVLAPWPCGARVRRSGPDVKDGNAVQASRPEPRRSRRAPGSSRRTRPSGR